MQKNIIIRNYNKFLTGTKTSPTWKDLYIHRFSSDLIKLIKFETRKEAKVFLAAHPTLSDKFEPWLVPLDVADWRD